MGRCIYLRKGEVHTVPVIADKILNNNSWATIRKISDKGQGANYWSIGDRKEIVLDGTVGHLTLSNYATYAFIIGFNHNAELEGNNRIHFQLAKTALSDGADICFYDTRYNSSAPSTGYFSMTSVTANTGGWASSQMRKNICGTDITNYSGTTIAIIPAQLRSALKSVVKYTDNIGDKSTGASAVTVTTDYFFLLSEYEVFGTTAYANVNEASKQAQYAYYSVGNSKIKYKYDNTATTIVWKLRSPVRTTSTTFATVGTTGAVGDSYGINSQGFAPGFCV